MDLQASLRLQVASGLEEGAWRGPVARVLSRGWAEIAARSLARPLVWRDGLRVVVVGGATLGGSGKTPLAIACARELAERGARVALVAHAYRAHPRRPRVVSVSDDLAEVGDEAIVCARALARLAPVVVAPTRQRALDHAAELADVVVIDGLSQTAPRRADLALLALDDETPWGAGEVVPRGDLKASKEALLEACDLAVPLGRELIVSRGAFEAARLLPWAELSRVRIGLFLALARPDRLIASLARRGIAPSCVVRVPDHGLARAVVRSRLAARSGKVDLWLASPKCAVHLESADVPHAALEHTALTSAALRRALDRLIPTLVARSPGHLAP